MAPKTLVLLLAAISANVAQAELGEGVDPAKYLQAAQALIPAAVETIASAGEHRALFPADSLGLAPGVEFGLSGTLSATPSSLRTALEGLGDTTQIPAAMPVPRLFLRKGLTDGVDLGFSGLGYSGYFAFGGDAQWVYRPRPDRPRVGGRFSFSAVSLKDYFSSKSYAVDLVLSHRVAGRAAVFEPYVAPGVELIDGTVDIPLSTAAGSDPALAAQVPTRLMGRHLRRPFRVAAGASVRMGWLRFVGEYAYSTMKISAISLKVAFTLPGDVVRVTTGTPDVGWSPDPRNTSF